MARRKLQKRAFNDIDRGTLGGLIFTARRLHGRTQSQVAVEIGRDRPWLSDVETGKITFVPEEDIRALARTLDLDARQLIAARDNAQSRLGAAAVTGRWQRACQSCGHANPDDANYCSNCGAQFPVSVECGACGRTNDSPANYCTQCGRALPADSPRQARPRR